MKHNFSFLNIILIGWLLLNIIIIIYQGNNLELKIIVNEEKQDNNLISMLVKQEDGTYKESKENVWNNDKYVFNEKLSGCENGSQLSFDGEKVKVTANKSDKCYVYFDYITLCEYIKKLYNKGGENNLYYHNGTIKIEDIIVDAEDYSYRYSGASDKVNNYVCFGGECSNDSTNENYANLYRIIGIFPTDGTQNTYQVKIIKADYATKEELGTNGAYGGSGDVNQGNTYYKGDKVSYYPKIGSYYWNKEQNNTGNDTNDWNKSNLNTINLNNNYINFIYAKDDGKWENMVAEHTWITEGNIIGNIYGNAKSLYNNEIVNPNVGTAIPDAAKIYPAKVGLMYASDYVYAAAKTGWTFIATEYSRDDIKTNNWLYMGLNEWTITRRSELKDFVFHLYNNGGLGSGDTVHKMHSAVRPCLYLKPEVKIISGLGTYGNPYILNM